MGTNLFIIAAALPPTCNQPLDWIPDRIRSRIISSLLWLRKLHFARQEVQLAALGQLCGNKRRTQMLVECAA